MFISLPIHRTIAISAIKIHAPLIFRPFESTNREMLNSSSWQLLLGLFVISAHPLPEWNIGTQSSDMAFSESLPESGIINTARLAPGTTDASSGFAQFPDGGNVVVSDGLISQGSSGCTPDTKGRIHRMRARNEWICPIGRLQLNNGEEKGRQTLPTAPNAQQGGAGQNSGGNGEPKRRLLFPPKDDTMSYLFMPVGNRPKQDSEICPDNMHPVPVCGRPSDAYALMYSDTADLTIEPCYPCRCFYTLGFYYDKSRDNSLLSTWS